jgi:hypothetical protein
MIALVLLQRGVYSDTAANGLEAIKLGKISKHHHHQMIRVRVRVRV